LNLNIDRLTKIYHGDFYNCEHDHIQDKLELFIIHTGITEYMRDYLGIRKDLRGHNGSS
jgi:hypothetical protein